MFFTLLYYLKIFNKTKWVLFTNGTILNSLIVNINYSIHLEGFRLQQTSFLNELHEIYDNLNKVNKTMTFLIMERIYNINKEVLLQKY